MPLPQETIVRTLFAARVRLSAGAWLIVRDTQAAEDIFQDVCVKALDALAKGATFENEARLISWAQVTTRHQSLNWLRARRPEVVTLASDVLEQLEGEWAVATQPGESQRAEALAECVQKAPPESRRLIELRYHEGRPCEEVAAALGCGLAAVYQRLSRLHRQLKLCVERSTEATATMPAINR
ncbi:MAG: sigma-70 family RNA polymerase sigma factor [Limisphaerales bacterium]